MQEKDYFEGILNSIKLSSDLLMHGALESSDDKICETMHNSLDVILDLQHDTYKVMEEQGWYQIECIDKKEINKALKKQEN